MLDVARFWLERGVDGFRLDTANLYFHDDRLRDNPVLPPDQRNEILTPGVNPYNWQNHIYDKNRPENLVFLKRLRALLDSYGARTTVGEISDAQRGLEIQAAYTSGGDKLHMCYDFAFLSKLSPRGDRVAEVLTRFEDAGPEGWACWAFSNHDVMRHVSRWGLSEPAARTYAALLLSLRGSICLYQGEELGLGEAYVPFEELQDPYGIRFWPKYHGRDGCRTPIPWVHDAVNGGFSTARPWLPLAVDHLETAVDHQVADDASMLRFYRQMIRYRQSREPLRSGAIRIIDQRPEFLSFVRSTAEEQIFCAFALSDDSQAIRLPEGNWRVETDVPFSRPSEIPATRLEGWQAFFARTA